LSLNVTMPKNGDDDSSNAFNLPGGLSGVIVEGDDDGDSDHGR
jgi:hypothetical protein